MDTTPMSAFADTAQIYHQSQIETQRIGCDLERSRGKMNEG